jgi:nicotinic acid mononucleotide adenylyltransferase
MDRMEKPVHISQSVLQRMRAIQALLDQLKRYDASLATFVPGSPRPRGSIIVLPGSFNPPTSAHLALLKTAHSFVRQQSVPFQLYAAFTIHTVDKETVERPLLLDRVLLLQKLLHRLPHTGILLINRGLYVEQAEGIRRSFPAVRQIFFLMGYDKIVQIFDPRYYEDRDAALTRLFSLAQLLVVPRGDADEQDIQTLLQHPQNQQFARFVCPLPFSPLYRDVSSTSVRQHMSAAGSDIPREVKEFMRRTQAYAPPVRSHDGLQIDYYAQRTAALKALLHSGT